MKTIVAIALCLLLGLSSYAAENENYKFRPLSPEGGFYYDGVKQIEQDKLGFIWVMMENELYRFDGYQYKKYRPYFNNLLPGKRWVFLNIAVDSTDYLYVNTNNGIFRYDLTRDWLEQTGGSAEAICIDGHNGLWIRNRRLWHYIDPATGEPCTPHYDGKEPTYTNLSLCPYEQDLYSFIENKIYRFNYVDRAFELCTTLPNGRHGGGVIRFAQIRKGNMWVFVDKKGVYQIDLATLDVKKHFEAHPAFDSDSLRCYFVDTSENIWFGTINGVYVLHTKENRIAHYAHSPNNPFSLPNNSVWTITEDKQSNIWIGMYSGQLCCVNKNENNAFTSWTPRNSPLSFAPVSAFAEAGNYLWIGTEGGGINRMDKRTGIITPYIRRGEMALNNVKSMVMDNKKRLWIATFRDGLEMYDTQRNQWTRYRNRPDDAHSLLIDDIRKVTLEADSGLWVAYQYQKPVISYFSFRTQTFTHYELDSVNHYLFDLKRQGENQLWALSNEALYCMNIHTHEIEKIAPTDSAYLGMYSFCTDYSRNIWIGTSGNGLVKYDIHASRFLPVKNIGYDNAIYTLCHDQGKIWMGTDSGLFCYDIETDRLAQFDKEEGTQGQVYYPLASLKGSDGKLYFGGTEGFTAVDETQFLPNTYKPQALISEVYIDQQQASPRYDVVEGGYREIVLDYDQNSFGFRFASDNYHIPMKNKYKYRLRGYDKEWVTTDAQNRLAMYSKVPAGVYYFEVCAANNDGVWNNTPTVIKVVRKNAPWLSWYAYLLYLSVLAGGIYFIYRHFAEKKKFKMLLYQESVERDKKEQIHEAQLRFFTNISHDFRTPLSLILAAVDKLRREGLKEYYYRILNSNAQRLLNLVNELMDFRTIENGMMKLELEPIHFNQMVENFGNDFIDYAKQQGIDFRIVLDKDFPAIVYADKHVVEKIVMNLLNNAFKYTREQGSIRLETRGNGQPFVSQHAASFTVGDSPENAFTLIVSDTGVGISRKSISNVFERFYKVNTVNTDSHLGTGIGLALVKSLVLLHKGSITIYSERDQGTDMVVRLPMDTSLFSASDFKQMEIEVPETPTETVTTETAPSPYPPENEKGHLPGKDRKKILLAEDNADLRSLIAEALSEDFLITQVSDGIEALAQMERNDFDLVISDIMMPHKDGVSLCYDIKHNLDTSHIPVVLLTAKTSLESKIEGIDSGADLYFEKPIDLTYLKLSLRNVFRNREQLKEHYAKNYYADSSELSTNEQDNQFMKQLTDFIEAHIEESQLDVNCIAEALCMSRSKLYNKVKGMTGKSIVEFVLNYRLRKAARLILEENLTIREIMIEVGIESPSYFSKAFKKVFGEAPTVFAANHKK